MSDKKERGEEIQEELEGLMTGDPGPGVPPPTPLESGEEDSVEPREHSGVTEAKPREAGAAPAEPDVPESPEGEAERLAPALEMLEERVTLLLDRHSDLYRRHREAVEQLAAKNERLDRLRSEGEDPEELHRRIREMEDANDRLSRHATFLERRIESLLNRVRYVVES